MKLIISVIFQIKSYVYKGCCLKNGLDLSFKTGSFEYFCNIFSCFVLFYTLAFCSDQSLSRCKEPSSLWIILGNFSRF